MPTVWLVNTSPFIALAKVRHLHLLAGEGRQVFLPSVVAEEVQAGAVHDAAVDALNALPIYGIELLPPSAPDPRLQPFYLDAGEVSVLTAGLAFPDSLCILDDGPGRAAGRALGLTVTGTLGVLLQARQAGRLAKLAPVIHALRGAGLYLPPDTSLQTLLAAAGEGWP